jgi:hypothetical protein
MTILHDNLYTKRAVSVLRGRNRYLSRAVWTVRVNAWRNQNLQQNVPVMKPNKPSSTTCLAERLVASNNFHPLRGRQKPPLPNPNPPRGRPVAPRPGLQRGPRLVPLQHLHGDRPRVPHRGLQVAHPPVHLQGLLLTLPRKHLLIRQQSRRQIQQQNRRRWNLKSRLRRTNPCPHRIPKPVLNQRGAPPRKHLPPTRS